MFVAFHSFTLFLSENPPKVTCCHSFINLKLLNKVLKPLNDSSIISDIRISECLKFHEHFTALAFRHIFETQFRVSSHRPQYDM
jgi:hypothetical protein